LEIEDREVVIRCLCGFLKIVEEIRDGMVITRTEHPTLHSLPRTGTKLSKCLGALYVYSPQSTGELAVKLDQTNNETAVQLTVLQTKGLAVKVTQGKGIPGGSVWDMSSIGNRLLDGGRNE